MQKDILQNLNDRISTKEFLEVKKYNVICFIKSLQIILLGEEENTNYQRSALISAFNINSTKLISNHIFLIYLKNKVKE